MSDDLKNLTEQDLIDRNVRLGEQIEHIKGARRLIQAELDERAAVERDARTIMRLPEHLKAGALAVAEPRLVQRVTEIELREMGVEAPAQSVADVGAIESEEAVGASSAAPDPFDDDSWQPRANQRGRR